MTVPAAQSTARRAKVTAIASLLLLTLVACGDKPKDPGIASADGARPSATASSAAAEQDPQKFADCMNKYGIDVKVENDGKGHTGIRVGGPNSKHVDENTMKKAEQACKQYAPGGGDGGGKPVPKEDQVKFLRFAQCMRDHGIPMEDPKFEGGGVRVGINGGKGNAPPDSKVQAAQKACQSNLPADDAPGGGSGGSGA